MRVNLKKRGTRGWRRRGWAHRGERTKERKMGDDRNGKERQECMKEKRRHNGPNGKRTNK